MPGAAIPELNGLFQTWARIAEKQSGGTICHRIFSSKFSGQTKHSSYNNNVHIGKSMRALHHQIVAKFAL